MIRRDLHPANPRRLCSARVWWPWLADADVPTPATVLTDDVLSLADDYADSPVQDSHAVVDVDTLQTRIGDFRDSHDVDFPIFVRTDQASAKHNFTNLTESGFIADPNDAKSTVYNLLGANERSGFFGLPYTCLMLREGLSLQAEFDAFDGTPIAPEVRVFVDTDHTDTDAVDCYHFYWPEGALYGCDADNWQGKLRDMRRTVLSGDHAPTYIRHANTVADAIDPPDVDPDAASTPDMEHAPDYDPTMWSVDFALADDGKWYAIDMALADLSWHPDHADGGDDA